jgi:hypothetical protein
MNRSAPAALIAARDNGEVYQVPLSAIEGG